MISKVWSSMMSMIIREWVWSLSVAITVFSIKWEYESWSVCCLCPMILFTWLLPDYDLDNILLGNSGSWYSCGCYFDKYHLPKDCCRQFTPLHVNGLYWQNPTKLQKLFRNGLRDIYGMCLTIKSDPPRSLLHLIPDTTGHVQKSRRVHASMHQSKLRRPT